jgi:hypothetical protein
MSRRLSIPVLPMACLLALLPLLPAQAADNAGPEDMKTFGRHAAALSPAIATTRYDQVLTHPVVAENLRRLTGPYYERISRLVQVQPVAYEPCCFLILQGYSAAADHRNPLTAEQVMIVVDWTSGESEAALRTPYETFVFSWTRYMGELLPRLSAFVREKAVHSIEVSGPHESWLRILDYRRQDPQVWAPARPGATDKP